MGRAAFITDPLAFGIHPDGIEPAQDTAAFGADAHDSPQAAAAEDVFCACLRVFPFNGIFCLPAKIASVHCRPFYPGILKLFYYNI
jgi:hypothetical protein